jgi:choline-sulfatase
MDIGTTLLDMAGLDPLPGASGRSFQSLVAEPARDHLPPAPLEGETPSSRVPINRGDTVFAEYAVDAVCRMVRSGPWKYNYYHGMPAELFNLENDPSETDNLAGQPEHADVERRLKGLALENWDPEWVQARIKQNRQEHPLIAKWQRTTNPPEPDSPWFDTPPDNHVDSSIRPPTNGQERE